MDNGYSRGANVATGVVIAIVIAAVLGVLTLITSIRFVGTGEVGVVAQYGRVTGRELSEGAHFVAPWGVNNVTKYNTQIQKQEADVAAASKDLQDVHSKLVVNYQIERGEVSEIHRNVGKDYQAKLIDPAIQESFKASSAKYDAAELITDRQAVKAVAYDMLKARLAPHGISVTELSITNFSFSKEFTDAIEDKQVARQNADRAKFNLEAAQTDAKAQQAQSETLSKLYLQKQAIEKWNGVLPQYVGGGDAVFNVPLR